MNSILKENSLKIAKNHESSDEVSKIWNFLLDYYFRLEMTGWENLPSSPSMLVGVHSGTWLTMDAWTLCKEWQRRFQGERILNGTAHDALMNLPVLGDYFKSERVIPANRSSITEALSSGNDVIIWPGGELDAMRSWSKRHRAVLGGRKGFIRQAIRSGVPIVPVATVGGSNTVFVLSECRGIAKVFGLKKLLRSEVIPLIAGFPFGISLEVFPMHIPLPAKIKTIILPPVEIDSDSDRVNDQDYVDRKYREVKYAIQEGIEQLYPKSKKKKKEAPFIY